MKIKIKILIYFLIPVLLAGCGLFKTRNPESPDSGKTNYLPPTSADIVITNFTNAIKEKNAENYLACLSDSTSTQDRNYQFIPSSDALSRYQGIFDNWNKASENRFFYTLKSNIPVNVSPILDLKNFPYQYDLSLPDSVIYTSAYTLDINYNLSGLPIQFSGTLQFAIHRNNNGYWYIQKWTDTKPTNDTTSTWSILKAQFSY
jgi:hypothetical protein